MRRLALGLAAAWLLLAFGFRMADMQKPQTYVSALTGGQRHHRATLAWLEGSLTGDSGPSHGRLMVVDVRIDGKLERYASGSLPSDWSECRLWLEEGPDLVQAVASCPGHAPLRLTAAGTSLAGLGPDNKPATLYDLYPVTTIEPEKIVNKIHRHDLSPPHPLLFVLGLLAMAPLGVTGLREWRKSRRLREPPILSGVMEHISDGSVTIRDGERRVAVFIEKGEVISVGLGRGAVNDDDTMLVDGLRAAVQGDVERKSDGAFRGRETVRLRRGAILVVGDLASEARRRFQMAALRDAGLAAAGAAAALMVAAGFFW